MRKWEIAAMAALKADAAKRQADARKAMSDAQRRRAARVRRERDVARCKRLGIPYTESA